MTMVDTTKFPLATQFPTLKATAKGGCVMGFCATYGSDDGMVSLVTPDEATLRQKWAELTGTVLDAAGIQRVAVFSQTSVTPNAELRGAKPIGEASLSNDVLCGKG